MKIIITESQNKNVIKKFLYKYWDKNGKVIINRQIKKIFHIPTYEEGTWKWMNDIIREWYETRNVDRFAPLKSEFNDYIETDKRIASNEPVKFEIKDGGYEFEIETYFIRIEIDENYLEYEYMLDVDKVKYNGEYIVRDAANEIQDDDEFNDLVEQVKDEVMATVSDFIYEKFVNSMAITDFECQWY